MPFCGNCGTSCDAYDKFCKECGTVTTVSSPPVARTGSQASTVCAKCDQAITSGKLVTALGRDWHTTCFSCNACSKPLSDEFYERDGKPYCEQDYDTSFLMDCKRCGQKIQGKVLRDNKGGVYHPTCFTCNKCGLALGTNFFWSDDLPVCQDCGTTKSKSLKIGFSEDRCANCKGIIETNAKVIHAGGMKYHDKCFTCHICKQAVSGNGKSFSSYNGLFCCGNCMQSGKAEMCEKCGQVLLGNKTTAAGKYYHEECFKCSSCRTLIPTNAKFFVTPQTHDLLCSLCQSART